MQLSGSSTIDNLSPDGQALFVNQLRRYIAQPDGSSHDVGPATGTSFWIDGRWHIAIGRVLFSVN